jgi:Zn-finger nucleic acid-binding protein
MRLIVACPECKRQYEARGIEPGRRFRCHCGGEITVRQPKGHSAAVVRCSSCGAPRDRRAPACGHCGADFTIHERDMHTVCPNCLARVSDQARFCHHCATALTPESVAGDQTSYHCPVCGKDRPLVSRRLSAERVTVLECEICAGLWLGLDTFRTMLAQQEVRSGTAPRGIPAPIGQQPGPRYRACVICSQLMVRRNLGRRGSGVIVDLCGQHGIWFDADELAQLMTWVRSGGREDILLDLARLSSSDDPVRRRLALQDERPKSPAPPPRPAGSEPFRHIGSPGRSGDLFAELAEAGILMLLRMFRR